MKYFILIISLFLSNIEAADPLYEILDKDTEKIPNCKRALKKEALSCHLIDVNYDLLRDEADIIIPADTDAVLTMKSNAGDNPRDKSLAYEGEVGDAATFTISKKMNDKSKRPTFLLASIHVGDQVFTIEKCPGRDCHVLIEEDTSQFVDGPTSKAPEHAKIPVESRIGGKTSLVNNVLPQTPSSSSLDRQTGNTKITIKVYYTQKVLNEKTNLDGVKAFVDLAIAETNTGYANSGVNMELELLGEPQLSTLTSESESNAAVFDDFENSQATFCLLRGGADVTILLVKDYPYCGQARGFAYNYGDTIGVVKSSCATGYYSFGHEIAHMFGANHNREQFSNPTGTNFGELFNVEGGWPSRKRSIMAYTDGCYTTRINYYSQGSTIINTPNINIVAGAENQNNAQQLNSKASAIAALSDNSCCQDLGFNGYFCYQYALSSCSYWHFKEKCPNYCSVC